MIDLIKTSQELNNDKVSDLDIKNTEKQIGLDIPDDLKFLFKFFNGVILSPNYFIVEKDLEKIIKINLYRLNSLSELIESYKYIKDYENISSILPIGDTLGDGFFIGINTKREVFGKIYLIDSNLSIRLIANNLTDFLKMLIYEDK